jgi:hypothetical protein
MLLRTCVAAFTLLPASLLLAQTPPAATAPSTQGALPSALLQPSLDILKSAMGMTNVDRWKASNAVKGEASANLRSIANDVTTTLPSLLATADAAPNSAAKILPAYRNADALYDVLLRVVVSANLYAPADQSSALDQALHSLEDSRHSLADQLTQATQSQDAQVIRLQAALKAVPPPQPPPPAPVCAPAPPAHKKPATKTAAKTTTKPAASTTH